jgi:hypothetical protein
MIQSILLTVLSLAIILLLSWAINAIIEVASKDDLDNKF